MDTKLLNPPTDRFRTDRSECLRRRTPKLLVAAGAVLVPWVYVLATTLPSTATVPHWAMAWAGLDTVESLGLLSTGVLLRRGDPRGALTGSATAAVLLLDAWLDTTTAASGSDVLVAVVMAIAAELPLAALCAVGAWRTLFSSRGPARPTVTVSGCSSPW